MTPFKKRLLMLTLGSMSLFMGLVGWPKMDMLFLKIFTITGAALIALALRDWLTRKDSD